MPKASRGAKTSGGRKASQPVVFKAAASKQEAQQYAKSEFGVNLYNSNWSLEASNAVNEALFKVKQEFGTSAFSYIRGIGTVSKGTPSHVQGYYNLVTQNLALRNTRFKQFTQKMQATVTTSFKTGHWSSNHPMQTVFHEAGHGIEKALSKQQLSKIAAIKQSALNDYNTKKASGQRARKSDYVSSYGFTSTGEFIAESVAAHLGGRSTPTTDAVIKVIKGG